MIDRDRQWRSLMEMAEIGATPAGGVCRLALTDEDKQSRDLFVKWAEHHILEVNPDIELLVEPLHQFTKETW